MDLELPLSRWFWDVLEAAHRTRPVPFLAVEEMLTRSGEHPLREGNAGLCIVLTQPSPLCRVLSHPFPPQVSWYQVTCPPCEIRTPPPQPPEKMSGMQVSTGQGEEVGMEPFGAGPRAQEGRGDTCPCPPPRAPAEAQHRGDLQF